MAPRILQETQKILQSFNFIIQEKIAKWNQEPWEKMGENEREERDFGIIELLWEIDVKMRREAFLLYEEERRNPSWMNYKCHIQER